MLDEQDIQKPAQVFATKAELEAAVNQLATQIDIKRLLSSIDANTNNRNR